MTTSRAALRVRNAAALVLAIALGAGGAVLFRTPSKPLLPPPSVEVVEVQPRPNVIGAVRELHELATAEQTVERVMDIRDKQSRAFGLVESEDALLLVASGTVTAGVDLAELRESDVVVEWDKRRIRMKLPPAKILSSRLDNERTYVHSRKTDLLATRAETLEGQARTKAEAEIVQAARDAGIVNRASKSAVRTLEAMLRGLGFTDVQVTATES